MKRTFFCRIMSTVVVLLICYHQVNSQDKLYKKMSIGTNFWNVAWTSFNEYFKPGIDFTDTTITDIWNPEFLEEISMYESLRFMDWGEINHSSMVEWSDRTLPHEEHGRPDGERRGVAYEWMIDLCNRVDADIWVCLPHAANDDFMRNFARLILDSLNPHLDVYVELSNEIWNFKTQQNYATEQGKILGLQPPDNTSDAFGTAMRWQAYRSAQMWDIWEQEFGADTTRLINVLSGWSTNPWMAENLHLRPIFEEPGFNPTGVYPEAYAIAPYFGGNGLDGSDPDIWDLLYTDIFEHRWNKPNGSSRLKNVLDHYDIINNDYNIDLIAYEGGQHLGKGALAPNRDPKMYEVYTAYLDTLQYYIGHFSHYVHLGSFSNSGCWGAMEYTGQPLEDAHKYRALLHYMERNRPPKYNYKAEYKFSGTSTEHEIVLTGIDDNNQQVDQSITINAISSDTTILPHPEIIYHGGDTAKVKLNPSTSTTDTVQVNLIMKDDGGIENNGEDQKEYTITVFFFSEWNNKPMIENVPVIQMIEDQEKKITLKGISDGDDGTQEITISTESYMNFFDEPLPVEFNGADTAVLTLQPDLNETGYDQILVTLKDNGGNDQNNGDQSKTVSILVNIIPVNDPPTMKTQDEPFEIYANSGKQDIIIEGIDDNDKEDEQEVTISITDFDEEIFESVIVLDHSSPKKRILELMPVHDKTGLTEIEITIQDDGGTEYGGNNQTVQHIDVVIKDPLGVKNNNKNSPSVIFPNPSTGNLIVSLNGKSPHLIMLTSIDGKVIKEWEFSGSENQIDLDVSFLAPGVYLAVIKSKDPTVTKKIVIK